MFLINDQLLYSVDHFKIMYVVDGLHFLVEPGELCNYFRQASQSIKEYVQVLITYKDISIPANSHALGVSLTPAG